MVSSVTDIYNLALSSLGARDMIAAPDETSRGAELCDLWYQPTVDAVFRAAPWPSGTAYARLGLVSERDFSLDWTTAMPAPEWNREYTMPGNLIRPRYLTSYARFDIGFRNNAQTLLTNEETAILCYTQQVVEPSQWDAQLVMAISHGLAANIAMGLTGKVSRARQSLEVANDLIKAARETISNEKELTYDAVAPWHAVRGVAAGLGTSPTYIYPFGPLLSLANVA